MSNCNLKSRRARRPSTGITALVNAWLPAGWRWQLPKRSVPPALGLTSRHVDQDQRTVLELSVNNHPGVMSHVCGLFSRRGYNVEGILCMPVGDGRQSRIWLMVQEQTKLDQMIKQMLKLEDVCQVRRHTADHAVFQRLEQFFRS